MQSLFKSIVVFTLFIAVLIVQVPSSFAYESQLIVAQNYLVGGPIQYFDITTPEGRQEAFAQLDIDDLMFPLFPGWWWARWAWKNFAPGNVEAKEIEAQRRSAVEIIRAGKENNVDELEITMSEKAGIGLNASVEGVPVEFIVGNSGNMTLKVKYKI